ncbi:MAG: hypothetical protein PHN78_07565 [Dehalococcoidales bacterium]|nr:hypothetical protein [Dehalococcoidales bacterium]
MNKLDRGIQEAIWGIIGGIIISALLSAFAKDGLIPSSMVFLFTITGFLAAIVTMSSFQTAGIIFTLGWILGAWMMKGLLSPFDFIVYLIAPFVTLAIRLARLIKSRK